MTELLPNGLSATQAMDKIHEGWLTSVELVEACLDQIGQTENRIHAWAHLDRETALAQAKAMDQIRQSGRPMGPLHGIPVAIKDIVDTADFPTELGSPAFAGRQPEQNATIINRLQEAGAVLLGKTVTTEFAFINPAETRNPHNFDYSPGGSSSGSAACVAAWHAPLAIGTQTGGSVIRPASYCGVYGFKPSRGVISRSGVLQTSYTLDHVGVFGRTLEDVALLADVLAGYDPGDKACYLRPRPGMLAGARAEVPIEPVIVWLNLPFSDRLEDSTVEAMEEIVSALGATVERIDLPDMFATVLDHHQLIHDYEIFQNLKDTLENKPELISDKLKERAEYARTISQGDYENALSVRDSLIGYFDAFFKDYDAILTPSATGQAPRFDEGYTGDPAFCQVWTLAGLPCLNLPLLEGPDGLPLGVQLVGGREEDDRLLRTANWLLTQLV